MKVKLAWRGWLPVPGERPGAAFPAAFAAIIGFGGLPAAAQSLEYFTGTYEVIGRDGGSPASMIHWLARMEPLDENTLAVQICGRVGGILVRNPERDLQNDLEGNVEGIEIFCSYYNNFDNYPHLVCYGGGGERIGFWPTMNPSADLLICGK